MRMMMKFRIPADAGTRALREGTLPKTINQTVETLRPEASYFCADRGLRTGFLVFDLKDASQGPSICEPLFALGAEVDLMPCMNLEDLKAGLDRVGKK